MIFFIDILLIMWAFICLMHFLIKMQWDMDTISLSCMKIINDTLNVTWCNHEGTYDFEKRTTSSIKWTFTREEKNVWKIVKSIFISNWKNVLFHHMYMSCVVSKLFYCYRILQCVWICNVMYGIYYVWVMRLIIKTDFNNIDFNFNECMKMKFLKGSDNKRRKTSITIKLWIE